MNVEHFKARIDRILGTMTGEELIRDLNERGAEIPTGCACEEGYFQGLRVILKRWQEPSAEEWVSLPEPWCEHIEHKAQVDHSFDRRPAYEVSCAYPAADSNELALAA